MPQFPLSFPGVRLALLSVFALASASAGATQLIGNGGFEADSAFTYTPQGWTVFESGGSHAVAADNALLGKSHASHDATTGPAVGGSFFGSINAYTAGTFALSQSFSTGPVSAATLSFKMFVNDQSDDGVPYLSSNLDWNVPQPVYYARVDLLRGSADPLATGTDVVKSLYIGGATGRRFDPLFNPYVSYTFDLSGALADGGDYALRFAVASNQPAALQLGVDNVSLVVTAVPEPSVAVLMLAGLGLFAAGHRRRRGALRNPRATTRLGGQPG